MSESVDTLKQGLKELLMTIPGVIAAWEGGSAATGRLDEYSDLDLAIVTRSVSADEVFASLEQWFQHRYGIKRRFRLPEPTWHSMSQCFYVLEGMPDFFYCDICVVDSDNPRKFNEPDRHGNCVIWFDPQNVCEAHPTPPEELEALRTRFLGIATDMDFLSLIELRKALARDDWMASHMNWMIFLNRHLIILMNLKYRPCKVDFGIRYAGSEFPAEEAKSLADLLRVSSCADIMQKLPRALAMYDELKRDLLPGSPSVDLT